MQPLDAKNTCTNRLLYFAFGVSVLCLSGCATSDVGTESIRRVTVNTDEEANSNEKEKNSDIVAWCLTCDDQVPHTGKYNGSVPIEVNKTVSISLRTIYVDDILATSNNPADPSYWRTREAGKRFQSRATVALLANVVEATGNGVTKEPDISEGRVIYASDDVLKKQVLNQFNLPVYGPKNYNGKPLYVRFDMYGIGTDNPAVKSLISSLASSGGKAFPQYSPVLDVLNKFGSALTQQSQGANRFMDYRMVFDSSGATGNVRYLKLVTGDYVLLKSTDRQRAPHWNDIKYDHDSGLLVKTSCTEENIKNNLDLCMFKDDSYIVFTINTGLPEGGFGLQEKLSELQENLAKTSNGSYKSLEELNTAIQSATESAASGLVTDKYYDKANTYIGQASDLNQSDSTRSDNIYKALSIIARVCKLKEGSTSSQCGDMSSNKTVFSDDELGQLLEGLRKLMADDAMPLLKTDDILKNLSLPLIVAYLQTPANVSSLAASISEHIKHKPSESQT